jgi:sulfur-carrier protein
MRVHIPSALRKWSGGRDVVELQFPSTRSMTVAEVIEWMAREFPGLRDRVLNEQGELRRHVNIFIDGEDARFLGGLSAPTGADSEMWIHPALSGGAPNGPKTPLSPGAPPDFVKTSTMPESISAILHSRVLKKGH